MKDEESDKEVTHQQQQQQSPPQPQPKPSSSSSSSSKRKADGKRRKESRMAIRSEGELHGYEEDLKPYIEMVKRHSELPGKSKLLLDYSDEATRVKTYLDLPPLEIACGYST